MITFKFAVIFGPNKGLIAPTPLSESLSQIRFDDRKIPAEIKSNCASLCGKSISLMVGACYLFLA